MANAYGSSTFARPPVITPNSYQYHSPDGTSKWKGPRRVCIFCSLAIVLPSLLIVFPLLMRFLIYGKFAYHLHPSDMRMLNNRISTIWCQGESIKVNTTFTAYVTPGEPTLFETPTTLSINQQMRIPDDQKEYWGLYLLPGSTFRIKTCSKFKGGTLLIVRGYQRMQYCAYVGEADSAGNSDEVSGSMSVEATNNGKHKNVDHGQDGAKIFSRLKNYLETHPNSRDKIQKTLEEWMLINSTTKLPGLEKHKDENETDMEHFSMSSSSPSPATSSLPTKLESEELTTIKPEDSLEHGKIVRRRRDIDIRKDTESGENGAFEDDSILEEYLNDTDNFIIPQIANISTILDLQPFQNLSSSIWKLRKDHNQHSGTINDTLGDDEEGSDSESESSFSSSEEALLKCEGIIASFKIPYDENGCISEVPFDDLLIFANHNNDNQSGTSAFGEGSASLFEFQVQERDYYYFIFGSENEKQTNLIRSKFELQKMEYRLPEPIDNCTDVEECQISFSFASAEKVVIKLPQPTHNATSNIVYVAETECKPRAHLYLIFVILVPVVILMFAFK